MIENPKNNAILIFARSAPVEAGCKVLTESRANDQTIHQAILHHIISVVQRTKIPFRHIDENQQRGSDFGERLANAFERLIIEGFENIICIGGDCPQLKQADIFKAINRLENTDFVLGPDQGGGMYLIGLRASKYQRDLFISTQWRKGKDFKSFVNELASGELSFSLLNRKEDIDNIISLKKLAKNNSLIDDAFAPVLRLLKIKGEVATKLPIVYYHLSIATSISLRAPPMF